MTLADIWDAPLPSQRHSPTSRAAAKAAEGRAGSDRAAVLQWFETHGPASDECMIDCLMPAMSRGRPSLVPSTLRARRVDLKRAGLLRDSGRKALTKSGQQAVIWERVKRENNNAGQI